jgi:hypothetical protein
MIGLLERCLLAAHVLKCARGLFRDLAPLISLFFSEDSNELTAKFRINPRLRWHDFPESFVR